MRYTVLKNRKTGKKIDISQKAKVQRDVVKYMRGKKMRGRKNQHTSDIAWNTKNKRSSVLQACKFLEGCKVLTRKVGEAKGAVMYHKNYGYMVYNTIEKLKKKWRKQGWAEKKIQDEVSRIMLEWVYRGHPLEFVWSWNADWEIVKK